MSHCGSDPEGATLPTSKTDETTSRKEPQMSRSPIALILALFATALIAVPAASARDSRHPAVLIHGTCTRQSTSKLKLSREDRLTEVEFQVDTNRAGVAWRITLRRNGTRLTSFTARTRAPSGSFEIRRVIARRLGTDRITAVATRATETCRASGTTPQAQAGTAPVDDHGHDGSGHS
jgi:hypothetical protein